MVFFLFDPYCCVAGFEELLSRVETSLEGAGSSRRRTHVYSSRNWLRRNMVANHRVRVVF